MQYDFQNPSYYLDVYLYFELYPEFTFKVGCFLRSGHLVYENRSRSMCVLFLFFLVCEIHTTEGRNYF